MLVRTAGVQRLIVVVNKMDDPTVEWSQERFAKRSKLSLVLIALRIDEQIQRDRGQDDAFHQDYWFQ